MMNFIIIPPAANIPMISLINKKLINLVNTQDFIEFFNYNLVTLFDERKVIA